MTGLKCAPEVENPAQVTNDKTKALTAASPLIDILDNSYDFMLQHEAKTIKRVPMNSIMRALIKVLDKAIIFEY